MASAMIPDQDMLNSLKRNGLISDAANVRFEPLAGGVSSDIWKVDAGTSTFCVKRALSKLKVAADWFAPIERNRYEVAWYQTAHAIVPNSAPAILAHDEASMLCAMEYLSPEDHPLWKDELKAGRADPAMAARVGALLAKIHKGAAGDPSIAAKFPNKEIFRAIRLEPYLEATAEKHPDLHDKLHGLSKRTDAMRLTLIHGDVSPKNILIGPRGPVFLDAECASIGDPAFDLSFCLNHFLLKCLLTREAQEKFIACFRAMVRAYFENVTWERPDALEFRACGLLPALFLARVDGKSPVEYINDDNDKDKVRHVACEFLKQPPARLNDIARRWNGELQK